LVWDISVAYYGCPYPKHVDDDLNEIYETGFTSITLCINEYEWPGMMKSKKNVVEKAHSIGLRVFIDIHGFGFFVPGHFSISVPSNPEWCEVNSKGRIYPLRGCPNNLEYRAWLKRKVEEIVNNLKPDGLFWDEPSLIVPKDWPDSWTCRCALCRRIFSEEYGRDMPEKLTEEVKEFRQRSLFNFLNEIMAEAQRIDGGIINILCLMPEHTGMHGVYSWEPVLNLRSLHVFSTDPYWIWFNKPFEWFTEWASRAIEISRKANVKSQIWVELIKVPKSRESDIYRSMIKAVELGADALATWSFRAEEGSELSCEDPENAWKTMIEAVRKIRSGL